MIPTTLVLGLPLWLLVQQAAVEPDPVLFELRRLQAQVAALRLESTQREEGMRGLKEEMKSVRDELGGLRDRPAGPVAAPFVSGPPPSSDSVGVAKVVVFAPRIEVDAQRRHDLVNLKVRRIEAASARAVSETELVPDQLGTDLTLDQNGALYAVEWSTSEGNSYSLVLKDGATGLPAATVQVKPLQTQGRFLFVGYRID